MPRAKKETDALAHLDDAIEVEIEHPQTGQRYGMSMVAYRELYEPLGYEVTGRSDGQPLDKDAVAPERGPELIFPAGEDATPVITEAEA